jgi:hypothetical protein
MKTTVYIVEYASICGKTTCAFSSLDVAARDFEKLKALKYFDLKLIERTESVLAEANKYD